MNMNYLFNLMKEKQASDMFFANTAPIYLKVNGNLSPIDSKKLDQPAILDLLSQVVSAADLAKLQQESELNVGVSAAGVGRFRLSAFRQRGSISAVFRFVPNYIPDLSTLRLPSVLRELIMNKRGLILVVGSTGSGKSTTIASMLDYRNAQISGHILTIEDPIEYLFQNKKSLVSQREVGTDSMNFEIALHNSLRQAPDCILIGEIRDHHTMAAAMSYAQSGHLVLATLHANNSYQALHRVISFFPLEQRNSLLLDLAASIRAVVSQRLIGAVDGTRYPAVEVLLNTRYIAELIAAGDISEIKEAIDKSLSPGSQSFEYALAQLITNGLISQEEGLDNADSPNDLLWLLNNKGPQIEPGPESPKSTEKASFSQFDLNV